MLWLLLPACNTQKLFPIKANNEVQQLLKHYLPQHATAPDDPAIFDSTFSKDTTFCPNISAPFWLIPSLHLPVDVRAQNSNNNVSICIFNHKIYVAFRTGPTHFASRKTGMYVISSADGTTWKKEMEFFIGRDFREPFLIPINGRLHFYCFAAGTKMTSFKPEYISLYTTSGDGKWNGPEQVLTPGEVHWSMKNRRGKTFLTSYAGSHYALKGESKVSLYFKQTKDGITFTPVGDSARVYFGGVSETAFEFDRKGNLWAVTRLEDGDASGFGSHVVFASKDSLGKWEFPREADPKCYMSPKMFRHRDEMYLIARRQLGKKPFGKTARHKSMRTQRLNNWLGYSLTPKTTALFKINQAQRKVEWVMDLPGAGDTAFPSIQRLDTNRFLVANYSSPTNYRKKRSWLSGQLGKTGIYLLVINFEPCP